MPLELRYGFRTKDGYDDLVLSTMAIYWRFCGLMGILKRAHSQGDDTKYKKILFIWKEYHEFFPATLGLAHIIIAANSRVDKLRLSHAMYISTTSTDVNGKRFHRLSPIHTTYGAFYCGRVGVFKAAVLLM